VATIDPASAEFHALSLGGRGGLSLRLSDSIVPLSLAAGDGAFLQAFEGLDANGVIGQLCF